MMANAGAEPMAAQTSSVLGAGVGVGAGAGVTATLVGVVGPSLPPPHAATEAVADATIAAISARGRGDLIVALRIDAPEGRILPSCGQLSSWALKIALTTPV